MSLRRQAVAGVRALFRRRRADQDVSDEVEHFVEQSVRANLSRGMSPSDARRAARLEVGSAVHVREQMRDEAWENVVETFIADVRYAARRLRAAPGFTVVTLGTLAIGIGATTAIFSAVNPILFKALPYPNANRVTVVWEVRADGGSIDGSFGMYRELAARNRSFEALAVFKGWQPTMTGPAEPERFEGQRVTFEYFRVLGITPAVGRTFEISDDRPGGPNVVILSDRLWRRRFAADAAIVGRQITLDDASYQVVGVLPPAFENVLLPDAELWAPLQYGMSQGRAWGHHLRTIGRLRAGVDAAAATRELNQLGNTVIGELHPPTYGKTTAMLVEPLQNDITRSVRPALLAVLGAVALVLIIACVNVTNLLLARGVRHQSEFALRAALGAERRRLIRQVLTESLLLSTLGGVAGIGVAAFGVRALVALSPPGLPRLNAIDVDASAFLFAFVVTTAIGVAFGLLPAIDAARSDPHGALQSDTRRATYGHRRARAALVVAEVALALVLLVTSGLLLRSLQRLFAVDVGFDATHVLTMQVQTGGERYRDSATTIHFFEQALAAVKQVAGVETAAFTSQLPLDGKADDRYGVAFESKAARPANDDPSAFRYAVAGDYIQTMRIPLERGRLLNEHDRSDSPPVALINESYAKRTFASIDPIGQRLRIGPLQGVTIVGVVGDVRHTSLAVARSDAVYVSEQQWPFVDNVMSLVVRTRGDAADLAPSIRAAIWSVDKDQPIVSVALMSDVVARSAAERRFALMLFEAFAIAALVLAAAGIYGVLSGSVAERTREMGVRSALGASSGMLLRLILRQGLTLTALGAAIGLVGAVAAGKAIRSMLFGVTALDGVTYAAVIALLTAVSALACAVPALRASRVDPALTLRAE